MSNIVTLDQIQTPTGEKYVIHAFHRRDRMVVVEWHDGFGWLDTWQDAELPHPPSRLIVIGPVSSLPPFTLPEKPPKPDLSEWPGWEPVEYRKAKRSDPYWDEISTRVQIWPGKEDSLGEYWILRQV